MSYTRTIIHKGYCIETRLLSYILFLFVVVVAAVLSSALVPASPTSGHTQGSFRIVAPPSEIHGKWRQIVGGLPSEGDTALLPSHFGGVQQYLIAFNIRKTPPTMPLLDDNVSQVEDSDRHYVPQPIFLCGFSDVEGFDQNCLRQRRREEHRDWGHQDSMAWRATEAETLIFNCYLCSDRWRWGW